MAIRTWNVVSGSAMVALLVVASAPTLARAYDNRVRLEAQLDPTPADPSAQGDARFESDSYDTELRVRVQSSTANDVVEVLINGVSVGEITLDEYGDGELDLDARNGDKVPTVKAGDVIEIVDAEDGTVLLEGTFAAEDR
jgi:hypothetical protein